jgi:hypothetical protein
MIRINKLLLPTSSIRHIGIKGNILNPTCSHKKIPGLDADFCEICRIYYVDEQETAKYQLRKKGIYE